MPVIDLGSVVGPQGPQGATGATGAQGIQGNPGPNQVTDQTSTNLNGVLFGSQSRVGVKPVDSAPTADSTNLVSSGGTDKAIKGRVPVYGLGKNLLRNWYFVGGGTGRGVFPVNQRGQTSYTASSASQFGPDAWKVYPGSTMSLTAAGVNLSNGGVVVTEVERNDSLWGRKVTLSVLTSGGLYTASGTMPSSAPSTQTNVLTISNSSLQFDYRIYANSGITSIAWRSYDSNVVYYAIKVEVGTEQTLCHNEGTDANPVWVLNEIPDYEYELFRCITSTADSTDTYANKTLATGEELAYVETGTTASRAYAVGEYFCWNGLLYRVTAAISSGGTFTPGTNCEQVTEGGMNSLLTRILNPDVITRKINCLVSNTSVTVVGGNDFSKYRAPVLCVYTDQEGNLSIWVIKLRSGTLTCTTVAGASNLTAAISGNDIIVSGVGNWGTGFAIGQR